MIVNRPLMRQSTLSPLQDESDASRPIVIIVDDDAAIREALCDLILSAGLEPIAFASTNAFLETDLPDRPGCLILDVRMPGASGLDLQHHLSQSGTSKPVVFLTGHGDIPMTVQAMKAGAVDFLTKPVRDQTLLDAVTAGIALDCARRAEAVLARRSMERYATLTPREREILHKVMRGRLNKQIAFDLGISEVTVKLHRGNGMRKMEAASLGQLVRAWQSLPKEMRESGTP
ncbi:response regulator transcription factor [Ancylobacter sp. A5.8]|uniref:response regulator transcription factor n=1 Tax=Ancylobacter gelatini TaxID=2919920 RepID=UPI001F4E08CB|nr:response regulator transcription factor [Ancylobacter gelatini]MCJ8141773.1 response regulator transcription factor [Ancylobacter gelatini]